jgi:ribonuclease D
MTIRLHRGDLPDLTRYTGAVAIDTETMGLDPRRDRLCVVQLSPGDGTADVVQIPPGARAAPNIQALLADPRRLKIFHFARFDIGMLFNAFGVMPEPVYCTKIASRLSRTYTDRHGLKDLTREILGIEVSKQQQSSDWGASERRAPSARPQGEARRHAGARGPHGARRRLLPVPARPQPARPCRLGRRGHFCPFLRALRPRPPPRPGHIPG